MWGWLLQRRVAKLYADGVVELRLLLHGAGKGGLEVSHGSHAGVGEDLADLAVYARNVACNESDVSIA